MNRKTAVCLIPLTLGLVVAISAVFGPAPVEADGLPTIIDLPSVEATSCQTSSGVQGSTMEALDAAAALTAAGDEECIIMVKAAKIQCKRHGPTSEKCQTAKDDAIDICMEEVQVE